LIVASSSEEKKTTIEFTGEPNGTCVTLSWLLGASDDSQDSGSVAEVEALETEYSTLTALIIETLELPASGVAVDQVLEPPLNYSDSVCGFGGGTTRLMIYAHVALYNYTWPLPPPPPPPLPPAPPCRSSTTAV
ncbi:hypothetical protein CYMTET_21792, partial [Cymbomonas tetramitiformis]